MSFDDLPPEIKGIVSIVSKEIGVSYAAITIIRLNRTKKKKRKNKSHNFVQQLSRIN